MLDNLKKQSLFEKITQILLPIFTIAGFILTSVKNPGLGLVFGLIAQIFWLYSSYKAWKGANQIGIFVTSIILTFVILFGVINYWLL